MIPQAHHTVERKSITVLELPRGNPRGSTWGDSRVGAPPRRGSLGKRWAQLCPTLFSRARKILHHTRTGTLGGTPSICMGQNMEAPRQPERAALYTQRNPCFA